MVSADVDINQLAPGEYHYQQLIGCEVLLENSDLVGKVIEIIKLPGQDLLSIERNGKEVLVPMVAAIVISIDVEKKKIVINPPEGLLDVAL